MAFKTLLAVTGAKMGDGDLKLAAGLCEEVGAHLAVLPSSLPRRRRSENMLQLSRKPGSRSVRPT